MIISYLLEEIFTKSLPFSSNESPRPFLAGAAAAGSFVFAFVVATGISSARLFDGATRTKIEKLESFFPFKSNSHYQFI